MELGWAQVKNIGDVENQKAGEWLMVGKSLGQAGRHMIGPLPMGTQSTDEAEASHALLRNAQAECFKKVDVFADEWLIQLVVHPLLVSKKLHQLLISNQFFTNFLLHGMAYLFHG